MSMKKYEEVSTNPLKYTELGIISIEWGLLRYRCKKGACFGQI